jgi:hypothetical protein
MRAQHPSRLALAIFDCFVADNEPLKGDLIEEFETRRSQWWLWRQVIGAVVCQPRLHSLPRERTDLLVLGAAVLVLLSFEAVFITNVMHHLVFGPPIANLEGYLARMNLVARMPGLEPSASEVARTALASMYAPLVAIAASVPTAWLICRFHQRHYALSRGAFAFSVMACTVLSIQLPFGIQFLTTLAFIVGLLMSGCVAVTVDHRPVRVA